MFRLGTPDQLWELREELPHIFHEPFMAASLKPLGHAVAVRAVQELQKEGRTRPIRVLEIGHGARSPFLDIADKSEGIECYGIDDVDKDKTVSIPQLDKLRSSYKNSSFSRGYIGGDRDTLPLNSFDFIFSISVVEHIAEENLSSFHADIAQLLVPGGIQFHSYDRPWRGDVIAMHNAVEQNDFVWLERRVDPIRFWEDAIPHVGKVAFEHPYIVMEKYMHNYPRIGRKLYNWCTVLMGARSPK